jgi:Inorganic Pyrophosphatase
MNVCSKCYAVLSSDECTNCSIVALDHAKGRIAVDFDKTLAALNEGEFNEDKLGPPIPLMLARVKQWLADGEEVCIFTARASSPEACEAIKKWCKKYIGQELDVTNVKSPDMKEFYDDKAFHVEPNLGVVDDHPAVYHLNLYGLDIAIEFPKGSVRTGKDKNGKEWATEIKYDYGRICKMPK